MKLNKGIVAVSSLGLFFHLGLGGAGLYPVADIVGYADIELQPGLNLMAVPFQDIGSTNGTADIQSLIASAEFAGMDWNTMSGGDYIKIWNPQLGVYEPTSHWAGVVDTTPLPGYDLSNAWIDPSLLVHSDFDLHPGRGFWLKVNALSSILGTFSGEVARQDTLDMPVLAGMDMFGAPYPHEVDIQAIRPNGLPGLDADYGFQTTLCAWNGSGYDTYGWCDDGQGTALEMPGFDAKWLLVDYSGAAARTFSVGEGFWILSPTNGTLTFTNPSSLVPGQPDPSPVFTDCIRQTNGVLLQIACPENINWNVEAARYEVFCKERLSDSRWFHIGTAYKPAGTPLAQILIPGELLPVWSAEPSAGSGVQPHVVTNLVFGPYRTDYISNLFCDKYPPLPGLVQTNFIYVAEGPRKVPERYFFVAFPLRPIYDADGDGAPDYWETLVYGSDPENPDTDGDGMGDFSEASWGLDPNDPYGDHGPHGDPDGDGLTNFEELIRYGYLVPILDDIDVNGIPDGWETIRGRNLEEYLAQIASDADADGLPTPWEIASGLDPLDGTGDNGGGGDPDGDGLSNLCEWIHGTHPILSDTDGDRLDDAWEIQWGFDPLVWNEGGLDTDGDGLSDAMECHYSTNPRSADTDGDGMPDAWEIAHGINPRNSTDTLGDPDGDGLANLEEYQAGTHPGVADTDGDGMDDYWEYIFGLDGANARGGIASPAAVFIRR